jgi:hypothetical protein
LGWQINVQPESDETCGSEERSDIEPVDCVDDTGGQD